MPVGKAFVNQVAAVLTDVPSNSIEIKNRLVGTYSARAVRYALTELVKSDRALRKGTKGKYVSKLGR